MKDYQNALLLYEKGASVGELANQFKITRQAMWMILKRRGCRFRSNLRYGIQNHFWRGTKASDKSQNLLEQAIEDGKIIRKRFCEECGMVDPPGTKPTKINAHHPDYNKPLDVMWLCKKCHFEWHKKFKAKEVMQ